MDCSMLDFPVLHYVPQFVQTPVCWVITVMPSSHLILCCLLLLPSVFPNIRVFSSELAFCIWWPKYWSFSISINPSNEYSELISFRIDWFDLLADQGTLKSLQNHSWKVSILQHSAFFVVQCSHPYTVSQSLSCVRLFASPWTIPSMEFSRPEYWSGSVSSVA